MFARRIAIERVDASGALHPCPVKWIDNFAMRNFTNDAVFDDTLPVGDGLMEAGHRVPLDRLESASCEPGPVTRAQWSVVGGWSTWSCFPMSESTDLHPKDVDLSIHPTDKDPFSRGLTDRQEPPGLFRPGGLGDLRSR